MSFIKRITLAGIIATVCLIMSCKDPKQTTHNVTPPPTLTDTTTVKGYGLLSRISGIWDGPVTSTTGLGSYPEWIVDFRPITAGQVSAKNELDTLNDIFMSFFIVADSLEYKLCFRNGGSFAGMKRVSYMIIDSVSENSAQSYYRFVDFVKGSKRTVTEVIFKGDSLNIRSYTNKNNTLSNVTLHMDWRAALQDTTSCQAAKSAFNYPKKVMAKDFTSTFAQMTESILYTMTGDPYPESAQPYLGQSTLSYTISPTLPAINPSGKILLFVTTQPMITPSYTINYASLKTRSRYVILNANDQSFTFNYMHPGSYYLYAFYDADGNGQLTSGDYVSTTNAAFTLSALGTASQTTQINYQMP
jgi:hypothetical protein